MICAALTSRQHRRGHDPVYAHAVLTKCFPERPSLLAPYVIQVPLRLAVVESETGRVAPVAGRRVAVANHCDVASLDQCCPCLIGIVGGEPRRDDQDDCKNRWSQLTDPASNAWSNQDSPLRPTNRPQLAWLRASIGYSITWSARSRSVCGMVSPRALAASDVRKMLTARTSASPISRMGTWYDVTSEGCSQASWQFPSSEGGGYG